jgi:hypothetical protein
MTSSLEIRLLESFEGKAFRDFRFRGRRTFRDYTFTKCQFDQCLIGEKGVSQRCVIENTRLLNCSQQRCSLEGAILQDVIIDGLNTKGEMPEVLGAACKHVTLRGRIDRFWIKPEVVELEKQEEFDIANEEFYKNVDWALDISQIDCRELDIRGIPVNLVRYDPETQAVVTNEKVVEKRWEKLKFKRGLMQATLELVSEMYSTGAILVAPRRATGFREFVADIKMLREEGVAEPAK